MRYGALGWVGLTLLLTSTAGAAPSLSHSSPVAIAEPGQVLGPASAASVASWDAGFLAVYFSAGPDILYGRQLDAAGVPQGAPFAISAGPNIYSSRVAFDGEQYVVVWSEIVDDETFVSVQRLSVDGKKVGATARASMGDLRMGIVFDVEVGALGPVVLACTREQTAPNSCRTFVPTDEGLEETDELTIAGPAGDMDLEASDGQLLAAFTTEKDGMLALRLGADGSISEPTQLSDEPFVFVPRIVATKDGWAILWRVQGDTRLSLVDFDGSFATRPTPLLQQNVPTWQNVFATSEGFLLFNREYQPSCGFCDDRVALYSFSPNWDAVGAAGGQTLTRQVAAAATASSGSKLLALWVDDNGVSSTFGDSSPFDVGAPMVPVSTAPDTQSGSRSAPGANGWLVAWSESVSVRARVLDAAGKPVGEPVTLGTDVDSSMVVDVAGSEEGWLVVWSNRSGAHATRFGSDGKAVFTAELPSEAWQFHAVSRGSGWVIACRWSDAQDGLSVRTFELGADGSISNLKRLSPFYASPSFVPTALTGTGESYRVWWAAAGTVHAKDVSGEQIEDVVLPAFEAPYATGLSAAQTAELSAVLWQSDFVFGLSTTEQPKTRTLMDYRATNLTVVGSKALLGWYNQTPGEYSGPTDLYWADGSLDQPPLDTVDHTRDVAFSAGRGNTALLTFSGPESSFGYDADQVHATVVTLTEAEQGGQGGAGGETEASGGAAGGHAAGATGEPAVGGDGEIPVGGESSGSGGSTAGSSAAEPSEEGDPETKTSRACGCRAVGSSHGGAVPTGALLSLLLALRRRRSAR